MEPCWLLICVACDPFSTSAARTPLGAGEGGEEHSLVFFLSSWRLMEAEPWTAWGSRRHNVWIRSVQDLRSFPSSHPPSCSLGLFFVCLFCLFQFCISFKCLHPSYKKRKCQKETNSGDKGQILQKYWLFSTFLRIKQLLHIVCATMQCEGFTMTAHAGLGVNYIWMYVLISSTQPR